MGRGYLGRDGVFQVRPETEVREGSTEGELACGETRGFPGDQEGHSSAAGTEGSLQGTERKATLGNREIPRAEEMFSLLAVATACLHRN